MEHQGIYHRFKCIDNEGHYVEKENLLGENNCFFIIGVRIFWRMHVSMQIREYIKEKEREREGERERERERGGTEGREVHCVSEKLIPFRHV